MRMSFGTHRRKALDQEMVQAGLPDAKKVKKRQKLERGFIRYRACAWPSHTC